MPTCLVVDDNLSNRMVAQYIMEDLTFQVDVVESADEASAALVLQSYDVLLLDWMMPHMDGIDFLSRIRQNPKHENLKVVMCSAKEGEANVNAALAAGANAYLAKPITFDAAEKVMKDLGIL